MNADQANMGNGGHSQDGGLPEKVLINKKVDEALKSNLKCSLCLDFIFKTVTLNCTHSFCYECLMARGEHLNFCATCGTPITNVTGNNAMDNLVSAYTGNDKANIFPIEPDDSTNSDDTDNADQIDNDFVFDLNGVYFDYDDDEDEESTDYNSPQQADELMEGAEGNEDNQRNNFF